MKGVIIYGEGDTSEEYAVREWAKSGLVKPTYVRLGKMLRLQKSQLINQIGRLSPADRMQIELRLIK